MDFLVGRQAAFRVDWAMLRSLPHTTLPDISSANARSGSPGLAWEGVLLDVVLDAIGLKPSHGFVLAHSHDGRRYRLLTRNLSGRNAMIATYCEGEPLTADCGGPARLQIFNPVGMCSLSWLSALQFVTSDGPRIREYSCDQKSDRFTGRCQSALDCSPAHTFHAKQIRSIRRKSNALFLVDRRRDLPSIALKVGQSAEHPPRSSAGLCLRGDPHPEASD
jgi:DMSO/TMAO reductase YedYZ molybdopterin-dependent catalytic subunit